jgi:hypothetical protein
MSLIPSMPNETALYIVIGIIGATNATQSIPSFLFGAKPENLTELQPEIAGF